MDERQRDRETPWRGGYFPGLEGAHLLREAEKVWGGPLPGTCKSLQQNPLRVELVGRPPWRILEAAGIPQNSPLLCDYWQLYVAERRCSIYHNLLPVAPLPALPAGLALCTDMTAVKMDFSFDDPAPPLLVRFYVFESVAGVVRRTWPDLAPDETAGEWDYYGLDVDPETLDVRRVAMYRMIERNAPPNVRASVGRVRRLS